MKQISYLTADRFQLHDWLNNNKNQQEYGYHLERFSKYYDIKFNIATSYKDYQDACRKFDQAIKKHIQQTFNCVPTLNQISFDKAIKDMSDNNNLIVNEEKEDVVYMELMEQVLKNKQYVQEHYKDKNMDICI